ncbi:unnamed protein product [Urochloa decumbens]|uniref:Uncharacterized protein n=1 Tax=Urochloa decumbens TaxID=240449 RepID=A0ABC9AT45_9POAL
MGSGEEDTGGGGGGAVRGAVLKALVVVGGVLLLRRLRRSTTRWDHARAVADALSGEKFSREQARKDPDNYFNLRMLTCPATEMVDGSRVLYFEQAFWRTPEKPFRQRFYMVKPCPKEMKCDVELSSYAIRDAEEYKNFCDRAKDQRPQPEEVIADIAEHLTTIHLSRCGRGKRCLYEGSTPPEGFPNNWICPSTRTVKYISGTKVLTTKETRFGEPRLALTSSSPRPNPNMTTCSRH